nr:hypothetical protein [uncultured Albidiferax sp.]
MKNRGATRNPLPPGASNRLAQCLRCFGICGLLLGLEGAHAIMCIQPVVASSKIIGVYPSDSPNPKFLLANEGIFGFGPNGKIVARTDASVGTIYKASKYADGLLIATSTGVYKLDQDGRPTLVHASKTAVRLMEARDSQAWFIADDAAFEINASAALTKLPIPADKLLYIRPSKFGVMFSGFSAGRYWLTPDKKVVKLPDTVGDLVSSSTTHQGMVESDLSGSYMILPNGVRIDRKSPDTGIIEVMSRDQYGMLVGAERGLFSVSDSGKITKIDGMEIGPIKKLFSVSGHVIATGANGLAMRTSALQLARVPGPDPGKIISIQEVGSDVMVVSEQGLFRISPTATLEKMLATSPGDVPKIHSDEDRAVVATSKSLWRLDPGGVLTPVPGVQGYPVEYLQIYGEVGLLQMQDRSYVLRGTTVTQISDSATGEISKLHAVGGATLVLGKNALALLDANGQLQAIPGDPPSDPDFVSVVGKRILIGSSSQGIFRIAGNGALVKVPGSADAGVTGIFADPTDSTAAYVRAKSGILALIDSPLVGDEVEFTNSTGQTHSRGSDLQVTWRTLLEKNPCLGVDGALKTSARLLRDGVAVSQASISRPVDAKPGEAAAFLLGGKLRDSGTYTVELTLRDPHDPHDARSFRTPAFELESTWQEAVIDGIKLAATSTVVLGILGSAVLLWGSRRYRWCFEFLTSNRWEALKIWYRPVIFYVRPLRLWVLAAYFDHRKRDLKDEEAGAIDAVAPSYLPVQMLEGRTSSIQSDTVHAELKTGRPLWVQGEAGTGKSELVRHLEQTFFSMPSWKAAIGAYGFLPIVVPVRDYPDTPDTPEAPWVAEVARHQFSSVGLAVEDASFFYRLLKCGDIGLVLDGLNEVDRDAAVQRYCNVHGSSLRVLVTSQSPPRAWDVRTVSLPVFDANLVELLLGNSLGEHKATQLFRQLDPQLILNIRSGYDVQLIVQCVSQDRDLPTSRLELYDIAFENALMRHPESDQVDAALCEVAWNMFLQGSRRFTESPALTASMLAPFLAERIVVLRPSSHEFRHDLMRAYCAARRIVCIGDGIQDTVTLLETPQLWTGTSVRPGDRRELLAFVCAMIKTNEDLSKLKLVAQKDIEGRASLFAACMKTASDRSWVW